MDEIAKGDHSNENYLQSSVFFSVNVGNILKCNPAFSRSRINFSVYVLFVIPVPCGCGLYKRLSLCM